MKQIMTVFGFTFRTAIRKKSFIISSVVMLALVLILCSLPQIMSFFSSKGIGNEKTKTCYFLDEKNMIPGALDLLAGRYTDTTVKTGEPAKAGEYRTEIEKDSKVSMIVISDIGGEPFITVTTNSFMSSMDAKSVSDLLTPSYISATLQAQGVDPATITFAQSSLPYKADVAGNMDVSGYALGLMLIMLMYFAIYYYGYGVSMSVATEKTTRVMETLVVSAKPSNILAGKCLAMGTLGLLQFSAFLGVGALGYKLMIPDNFTLMGMPLSLSAFTLQSGLLVLLYFVLGYALYAVMNAVCGAFVSKIEDLNSAMMPVVFITLISFYVGYFAALSGTGGLFQKVAMYVPFCSPFVMPFKLLNSDVSAADIAISLSLLLAAVIVVAFFSARIYTASVLHYGKRMKLMDLYRTKI